MAISVCKAQRKLRKAMKFDKGEVENMQEIEEELEQEERDLKNAMRAEEDAERKKLKKTRGGRGRGRGRGRARSSKRTKTESERNLHLNAEVAKVHEGTACVDKARSSQEAFLGLVGRFNFAFARPGSKSAEGQGRRQREQGAPTKPSLRGSKENQQLCCQDIQLTVDKKDEALPKNLQPRSGSWGKPAYLLPGHSTDRGQAGRGAPPKSST